MGEHRSRSRSASRNVRTFSVPETAAPPTPWLVALCDLFLLGAIVVVPLCYEGRTPTGNLLLTLCFWVPGAVHAILVANDYYEDRRQADLLAAMARLR